MSQTNKLGFLFILGFIFLLPLFFVPGSALSLDVAKSAFLVLGTVATLLVFLFGIWKGGRLSLPWHPVVALLVALPIVYFLSAIISTPSSLSLLGYNFETGTFGYILVGTVLVLLVSSIFADTSRLLQALVAFFLSISVLAVFVFAKVLAGGDILVWGNFFGSMGNPIGNWTDLALVFGLLSVFSALALGLLPMQLSARLLVYGIFILGLLLLAVVNFSVAFYLVLVFSVVLILYFWRLERRFSGGQNEPVPKNFLLKPIFLPIVLAAVSTIFLINPTISDSRGRLGDLIANSSGVQNVDVRPSLSATLDVSKAVLSEQGFLGSGPNTFGRDWLIYKTVEVNTTPFWSVSFPFGVGFVPTQIASTGVLGSASWLAFFALLAVLITKSLMRLSESRAERFNTVSTTLIVLFLWAASFIYTPSATVMIFAFIFTGLMLGSNLVSGTVRHRDLSLKELPRTKLVSLVLVLATSLGALYLGWSSFERVAAAFHFKKAVDLSNVDASGLDEMERLVGRAISSVPSDIYYVALSRINFAKAQRAANLTTGSPAENQALFENSIRRSIEAARQATDVNSLGYQNWTSLGLIYSALVPPPLLVSGAYENASLAYAKAGELNPQNPETPLLIAQLELNNGDRAAAISQVRRAIALKEDYANAHLLLAQLEIQAGNIDGAISSAGRLALLTPDNPGIHFELGVLKYSSQDYTGAEETFRRALSLTPDYANAQYYLGLTLAQLGRLEDAREQFEALLVTNPDNEEVQRILRDIEANRDSFLDNL